MHVQINSDSTISIENKLSDSIGAYILDVLRRFDPYLTRVEVHLTGQTNRVTNRGEKRCVLEARPKHHRSLIVSEESPNIETAFSGAAAKLHKLLETTYGRLGDKRRRKNQMTSKANQREITPNRQLFAS